MANKFKLFLLISLFIIIFSPATFANLESISTIGQAETEIKADQLLINFTIRGESQNQGQLTRDFNNTTQEIIGKLADKDIISKNKIETTTSDVATTTKNNQRVYYKEQDIAITTDKRDFKTDSNSIKELFEAIKDLDPARQKVRYNVRTDISFSDYQLYLTLDNRKEINQNLIEEALENAEEQVTAIANQTGYNVAALKEISEKESNNLINYKKRLDINSLDNIELKNLFDIKLKIKYSVR